MYRYNVTFQSSSSMMMAGFLDMLRYDQATVDTWTSTREGARSFFTVTLVTKRPATLERWASFGLVPQPVAE